MRLETSIVEQQKLFTTQYTAVFLIMLTFVVGAFARPPQKRDEPPVVLYDSSATGMLPLREGPLPAPAAPAIGALRFERVFDPETNNLDVAQLTGVVEALRAHDIGVRVSVTVPASDNSFSDSAALVARMVSTYRWLETLKLPKVAYQVEGSAENELENSQLKVEFIAGVQG